MHCFTIKWSMAYFYLSSLLGVNELLQIISIIKSFSSLLTAPLNSVPWSNWSTSGYPCLWYSSLTAVNSRRLDSSFSERSQTKRLKKFSTVKRYLYYLPLALSWRRSLSYKNHSTDLLCKSMDWFLYDSDLQHERIKRDRALTPISVISIWFRVWTPFARVIRNTDLLL